MPRNVVINPYFDWAGDQQLRTPYHETLIYEAHVRGLTLRHPGVPEELRGSYAGLASPAIIEHLQRLGVTAIELMPVHQSVPEPILAERGLTNYWGYNTIGFFAPHQGYGSSAARARPRRRVQVDGQGAAPGGHRGHTRRGLQPHRRGRRTRADAQLPRHRQRRVLPARRRRPVGLPRLHRLRQQPQRAASARAPADHGLAAVLDRRDARRRVPVRPRLGAREGVARRRPAVCVLRPRAAGPAGVAGQAHRRAVGRRRGRVPGGQVPAAVDRVEREVPRHGARLLARIAWSAARAGVAADRVQRPVRDQRAAAGRIGELRDLPRRVHAARSRFATTTSTTRPTARTTTTAPTTTGRGTAAPKGRPTTRRSMRCANGRSGTSW